ncbi:MAG: UBP-type zinc finger domain-containing protein [Vicinamibacterales bacterium]
MMDGCEHLRALADVKVGGRSCEECVKTGDSWVHLRTCQSCGRTLCCDSSPNRHSRRHAMKDGHTVFASAEPGERWVYCFADDAYGEY